MNRNRKLEKINETFNIFHDGTIESYKGDLKMLTLKVSCLYLAELIQPDYEYFYLKLENISAIYMEPWIVPYLKSRKSLWFSLEDIFQYCLGILSGDIEENILCITMEASNREGYDGSTYPYYQGGNLYLICENIEIFDEKMNKITLKKMISIAKSYWTKG